MESSNSIKVVGARTHNLKNIDVEIPRDKVVVITGPSGSGKSSLAIDTLSAEAQRQFFESLSIHSRQFFKQLPAAKVDSIQGLPPTVFIDQASGYRSRRSTVGTITEIYDYLRLLMARCGVLRCHQCGQTIAQHTIEQIQHWVLGLPERTKIIVLAPLIDSQPGDHSDTLEQIRRERLVRVRVDGLVQDIDQVSVLSASESHSIAAVTDRLVVRVDIHARLLEAIEMAARLANGRVIISFESVETATHVEPTWQDQAFSTRYACPICDLAYQEVHPNTFSFNSPEGVCPACHGLGEKNGVDRLESDHADEESALSAEETSLVSQVCPECHGSRLNEHARSVFLDQHHLGELVSLPIHDLNRIIGQLQFNETLIPIAEPLTREIQSRLSFLEKTGVEYLSLGRGANSLSGGEYQRVRLATSIGSGLTNIGYVLDEPSVGLHPRDTQRLIDSIRELQEAGNSVILVEHDDATIRQADYIIDMGPHAGKFGGNVVACGSLSEIIASPHSPTGCFLSGQMQVAEGRHNRIPNDQRWLSLNRARGRNLKDVDLRIPLGLFSVVTGVSGSGKSTLINQTLVPALINRIRQNASQSSLSALPCLPFESMGGSELIQQVAVVDQLPIGRSARGCPATVMGIFDSIRKIFAATKTAKQLGFGSGRFSFNLKAGWCPDCRGLGSKRIQMNLIPDFFVVCESCQGQRFNLQTLQVRFNEHTIADVLNFSVVQARTFFDGFEAIARPLQSLLEVGLGYLQLGQATTTLSGGESQRLKLAHELAAHAIGHTLYVLDEPTTGLHFGDVRVLLKALNQLVDAGNSLIVIEHNLDVIRSADWIIDIGPEGGELGGRILGSGPVEAIRKLSNSYTAKFLQAAR